MEYRNLGKWGIQVSALSFGTWITFGKQIDEKTSEALIDIAYNSGVNFFDAAEIYARGKAEEVLGNILQKRNWQRSSYILSSKIFFGYEQDLPNQKGLSHKHIIEGCHAALKRLKTDYIDLFFRHRPDKTTPIEETVWAMNVLIQQGKILYWGTSEWSNDEILEAIHIAKQNHLIGPRMEQPQYNFFERIKLEKDFLHLFKEHGLGTTIWSPLASGLLSGKYLNPLQEHTRLDIKGMEWLKEKTLSDPSKIEKTNQLHALALELGTSLNKLSIAWVLKNPNVSTAILGASKPNQLIDNLKSLEVLPLLTDDVMKRIETIIQNKPTLSVF